MNIKKLAMEMVQDRDNLSFYILPREGEARFGAESQKDFNNIPESCFILFKQSIIAFSSEKIFIIWDSKYICPSALLQLIVDMFMVSYNTAMQADAFEAALAGFKYLIDEQERSLR